MRNLLNFLIKYNSWFLFLLLEVACFALLFRFNYYQGSVLFTSANRFAGKIYEWVGSIHSYFYLRTANEELMDRNLFLERKVEALTETLSGLQRDSAQVNACDSAWTDVRIIKARVINNTLNRLDNYMTLDKGSVDGVRNDMGVVSIEGVAGIVCLVSPHYALAISVLNRKSNINCKVQGTGYFGYLKWDGGDSRYAYVRDLPRYAEVALGDTVVTNGYSSVFPAGIMIGRIVDISDSDDGLSHLLRVELATDFGKLNDVRLIVPQSQEERTGLERNVKE